MVGALPVVVRILPLQVSWIAPPVQPRRPRRMPDDLGTYPASRTPTHLGTCGEAPERCGATSAVVAPLESLRVPGIAGNAPCERLRTGCGERTAPIGRVGSRRGAAGGFTRCRQPAGVMHIPGVPQPQHLAAPVDDAQGHAHVPRGRSWAQAGCGDSLTERGHCRLDACTRSAPDAARAGAPLPRPVFETAEPTPAGSAFGGLQQVSERWKPALAQLPVAAWTMCTLTERSLPPGMTEATWALLSSVGVEVAWKAQPFTSSSKVTV